LVGKPEGKRPPGSVTIHCNWPDHFVFITTSLS
jgi:hypothetical protein